MILPRSVLAFASTAVLVFVIGCSSSEVPSGSRADLARESTSAYSATPSPTLVASVAHRTLDFEDRGTDGSILARIPYGAPVQKIGLAPTCRRNCAPPCPCSAPVQASAFDIDDSGRFWVLDNAKRRVVVFDESARYLFHVDGGRDLLVASDLQRLGNEAIALSQDRRSLSRIITLDKSNNIERSRVSFEGDPVAASRLIASGERLFSTVFYESDLSEEEVPVELLSDGEASSAAEVPGRPFLDGWLLFEGYVGPRVLPLSVSTSQYEWSREIRFKLKQSVGGRSKARRGNISWETEVDPAGIIHLLVFAGTDGREATDGYWYLMVEPDGTVGVPIHLRGPTSRDDQQARRLTLDSTGRPVVMWARGRAAVFELIDGAG